MAIIPKSPLPIESNRSIKPTTREDILGMHSHIMQRIEAEGLQTKTLEHQAKTLAGVYLVNGRRINVTSDYLENSLRTFDSANFRKAKEKVRKELTDLIIHKYELRKRENPNLNLHETISDMSRTLRMQDENGIYSASADLIEFVLRDECEHQINIIYGDEVVYGANRKTFVNNTIGRLGNRYGRDYVKSAAREHWDKRHPGIFKRMTRKLLGRKNHFLSPIHSFKL